MVTRDRSLKMVVPYQYIWLLIFDAPFERAIMTCSARASVLW
jgi:hypothetical protein